VRYSGQASDANPSPPATELFIISAGRRNNNGDADDKGRLSKRANYTPTGGGFIKR